MVKGNGIYYNRGGEGIYGGICLMVVFCDACGSLMFPSYLMGERVFKCRCGTTKPILEEECDSYKLNTKMEHDSKERVTSVSPLNKWKDDYLRSEVEHFECPKCHCTKAYIKSVQVRKSHKGMTQYLVCLGCDKIIPIES